MKYKKAIDVINKSGVLLVFPVNNRPEPDSLWARLYPRAKMEWKWDSDGDDRVGEMWGLMKKLSDCGQVVYSKWYQGRATFFSRTLFTALLRIHQDALHGQGGLSRTALDLLEILEGDSPLSTKQLKKMAELQGKDNEKIYQRAMKQLFKDFHIVAYGEVDDGAFPSLAIGATRNLYEDLWSTASEIESFAAQKIIDEFMPDGSLFRKYLSRSLGRK